MALPINIKELLNGRTVEWERIEFREGWNPERTLRTICAFANDFNNWGGGYVILGVAEKNGIPVLPPNGLQLNQINPIQNELNSLCRKILPNYFPIVEPVDYDGKKILVLWCPGGSNRPYKAPETLGSNTQYFYYIRRFSSTVQPTREEERELLGMSNQIPFDDRVNHQAQLSDFDLSTIKIYLNEIGSDLEKEIPNLSIDEIARRMNIAEGGNENLIPKNIGLLFFAKNIHKFFPYAKIEFVVFKDESGTDYTEKIFEGPIHNQLKNALDYFKNSFIEEKIIKQSGKAEALRFYSYPYEAFEEALCNAVYHRGYDNNSPIEVRIFPDKIDIISFPGPLPPLDKEKLLNFKFEVRKYRNRRIGEFLKELHLTEGRSTGIPTILREMEKNASPKPVFETDEERSYFKTTLFIHPSFIKMIESEQVNVQVSEQAKLLIIKNLDEIIANLYTLNEQAFEQAVEQVKEQVQTNAREVSKQNLVKILSYAETEKSREQILSYINLSDNYGNYKNYIYPLLEQELLNKTLPSVKTSPNQKYKTTEKGKKLLKILK